MQMIHARELRARSPRPERVSFIKSSTNKVLSYFSALSEVLYCFSRKMLQSQVPEQPLSSSDYNNMR